jgi:hypothetical protein
VKPVVLVAQSNNSASTRVFFKIHRKDKTEVLAICDECLLGKELSNEKIRMKVRSQFYRGNAISKGDALDLMRRYSNINALGSVLELGIEKKVINEDAVFWLNDDENKVIPHLLIFSMPPI